MSTEHQRYSTENQKAGIAAYAARRGLEVVRTYADEGKSGLTIGGRPGLQQLLADIQEGRADFQVVLVFDISRWGRFQDVDESAYYEYLCRKKGITIEYCAEPFDNDGSIASTIVKTVKRAMAGEYSRELSAKVFAGHCRLAELGFRQGGVAGYGLRRLMLAEDGTPKALLASGEHKSLQTCRVVLVPGPPDEVEVVRWIFRAFAVEGLSEDAIAQALNRRGLATHTAQPWSRGAVRRLLTNEKYIGHNVYNRTSTKLGSHSVRNSAERWVRRANAFEAIVEPTLFAQVAALIESRAAVLSDAQLLDQLRNLLQERGRLTGLIIDEAPNCAGSTTYQRRFGSLLRAYTLIGYRPTLDLRYLEINRHLRALHPQVTADFEATLGQQGATWRQDANSQLLVINDEVRLAVVIARCRTTSTGLLRWKVRLDNAVRPDFQLVVRMQPDNSEVRDCYLLPAVDRTTADLGLHEDNGFWLDSYRMGGLDEAARWFRRSRWVQAA